MPSSRSGFALDALDGLGADAPTSCLFLWAGQLLRRIDPIITAKIASNIEFAANKTYKLLLICGDYCVCMAKPGLAAVALSD